MKGANRAGYSLASLLLLTAVAAIFLAATRMALVEGRLRSFDEDTAACAAAGALIGLGVGAVVGGNQPNSTRARIMGSLIGMLVGVPCGILVTMPGTFRVFAVGSVVLVVFSLVVRSLSNKEPEE